MKTAIVNVDIFHGANQETGAYEYTRNGCVHIDGGQIVYAGGAENAPAFDCGDTVDGRGMLLMPGLCNAHTHNGMTLLRGAGSGLTLHDWLYDCVFPAESRLTPEMIVYGARLAMMEMLRFGVTSFADMYMNVFGTAQAVDEIGMRALLCDACVDFGNGEKQLQSALSFFEECRARNNPRIRASITLHAEYTTNEAFVSRLVEKALPLGNRVHVHLSETKEENEGCIARHGETPTAYFHRLGLFQMPTLAAHGVWLSGEDIGILARDGVTVAHNPVSNMKLGSGVAPVAQCIGAGVPVALGTDGVASNNTHNLWEEVRLMPLLQMGTRYDPCAMRPAQVLAAATNVGARALGFDDVGYIREGYRADLILLDRSGAHWTPCRDIADMLVYAAQGSDVRLTMVDGKVLYRDGEYATIDKERTLHDVQACAYGLC